VTVFETYLWKRDQLLSYDDKIVEVKITQRALDNLKRSQIIDCVKIEMKRKNNFRFNRF